MKILSPAKINICLDVTGKRQDGYHELDMIMQAIPLYDTLEIEKHGEIEICGDIPPVDDITKSIMYKSAKLFFEYTGINGGAKITVNKQIPDGAGLGGSSSNGSSIITALNILYSGGLTNDDMEKIAVKIGADMPFFIKGGCQIAKGIGEKLTPCEPLKNVCLLLVKPQFSINTKQAYSKINIADFPVHKTTADIAAALGRNDIAYICENTFNMIEFAVDNMDIKRIKSFMLKNGADGALMTGSGSCTYGIFTDFAKAENCQCAIKKEFSNIVNFTKLLQI